MKRLSAAACNTWRSRGCLRAEAQLSGIARIAYRMDVEAAWRKRGSRSVITPGMLDRADAACGGKTLSPRDWLWFVEERVRAKRYGIQMPLFN